MKKKKTSGEQDLTQEIKNDLKRFSILFTRHNVTKCTHSLRFSGILYCIMEFSNLLHCQNYIVIIVCLVLVPFILICIF